MLMLDIRRKLLMMQLHSLTLILMATEQVFVHHMHMRSCHTYVRVCALFYFPSLSLFPFALLFLSFCLLCFSFCIVFMCSYVHVVIHV